MSDEGVATPEDPSESRENGSPRGGDVVIAALYHFARLNDLATLRENLQELMRHNGIRGNLLLAPEGINGTVSGSRVSIDMLLSYLCRVQNGRLQGLIHKESYASAHPFLRAKCKLKKEIVTLGVHIDPTNDRGTYVKPTEWNDLITQPDVLVIDTRNDYEIRLGTFRGAENPGTTSFREFPAFVRDKLVDHHDKSTRVAMFCTGGIRCEKSTSLLKKMGFHDVFHLQGGILKYLEEVPQNKSLFSGECYVFDERVAVTPQLESSTTWTKCRGCRHPINEADMESEMYVEGVSCPHCYGSRSNKSIARSVARHEQGYIALMHNCRVLNVGPLPVHGSNSKSIPSVKVCKSGVETQSAHAAN